MLWPKRYELSGLALIPVFFCLSFYAVQSLFGPSLWCLSCGAVGSLVFVIVWLCARYVAPRDGHCVAICLGSEDGSLESIRKIAVQLQIRLREIDSRTPIKLKILPRDVVKSAKQAERYLQLTGIALVVWGTYQRQCSGSRDVDRPLECRFNTRFAVRVTRAETLEGYRTELEAFLRARWHKIIRCDESAIDLPYACEDYVELILGLLAPVCLNAGDAASAAKFAEAFLARLDGRPNELVKYLRGLAAYSLACQLDWTPELSCQERLVVYKRIWEYSEFRNSHLATALARCCWENGDHAGAVAFTEEIERLDQGNTCYAFNKGFLSLHDGHYDACAKWYGKAYGRYRSRGNEISLAELVAFLDAERAQHPTEIEYLLALGIANCAGLDIVLGCSDLRTFVRQAKKRDEYKAMVDRALVVLDDNARKNRGPGRSHSQRRRR